MEIDYLKNLVRSAVKGISDREEYLIIRAQMRSEWSIRFNQGKVESVATGHESGIGVQAFTREGITGFASTDVVTKDALQEISERAASLARANEGTGALPNQEIFKLAREEADLTDDLRADFWDKPLAILQEEVKGIHLKLSEAVPQVSWQTSYRQIAEVWVIGRSDQTLISFAIPRAILMHQGTLKDGKKAQSFLVHRSGTDWELLLAEAKDGILAEKGLQRARFTERLLAAPQLPPGNYPLIIDYGLAKGLAHEAFGHAVESDHMQESVLGENGKLKRGLRVAREGIHIIDGPLAGDWAFHPYSANGIRRQTVEIVKDGILQAGLGDVFSAAEGGMPVTGAGRAESYSYLPLPRMSNIRLLLDKVLPLETSPDIMKEAQQIRETLKAHGELKDRQLVLVGYRGGQVNPKTGDFVFQCSGIIDVGDPELPIFQPAIFSGKILSALKAIRYGLGGTCFDAIGTCGKGGQAVSSSGGSHKYVMMDQDKEVSLGGEAR